MPVLIKVLGFSLTLTLGFTLVTNLLPQIEGEAPVEKTLDLGAFTEESFVALGEELFKGKGTCTLCHNDMGRAPDILKMNMVETANDRLADSRYQGDSKEAEAYLQESMRQPSLYVVKGFGKKGTNDSVSPMPAIDKPPIQLSEIEMNAVIAYMQAKDGNPVTVSLPSAEAVPITAATEKKQTVSALIAETAQDAIGQFGCTACHSILETESPVGPDLRTVGSRLSADEIRQSILEPNAVITEGYSPMMPGNFADKMRVKELEMIVQFLAEQIND
ncbi:MAG: cytochrome C [Gammaproteobacteria bacterium]|nr:MAG: cytochrome C [Gammaproteobacteria bacterium]RKZ44372.1 MAG: cytochrome C [Gammaproteobacteria bacterium]